MSLGFQLSQSRQNLIAQITSVIYIWMQTETDLILQICLSFVVGIFEQVMVTAEGRDAGTWQNPHFHSSGIIPQTISQQCSTAGKAGAILF